MQLKFDVLKRTANSVIADTVGRFNALVELKKKECEDLENKIKSLKDSISKLTEEVNRRAELSAKNRLSEEELVSYRKLKKLCILSVRDLISFKIDIYRESRL